VPSTETIKTWQNVIEYSKLYYTKHLPKNVFRETSYDNEMSSISEHIKDLHNLGLVVIDSQDGIYIDPFMKYKNPEKIFRQFIYVQLPYVTVIAKKIFR